jgi:NAD(P) transhydrogenase
MDSNTSTLIQASWMLSSVLFVFSLGGLSKIETARKGNYYGMFGMLIAIFVTFFTTSMYNDPGAAGKFFIAAAPAGLIGTYLACKVKMEKMPQLVAMLHSFVGAAATIVGYSSYCHPLETGIAHSIELFLGIFIGTITFIGSLIAYGKLDEKITSKPLIIGGWFRHVLNLLVVSACIVLLVLYAMSPDSWIYLVIMTVLALFLGWHLIMAIGGADMPVVVSMLNSYSGWATSASGFMLSNPMLIIVGALVGSSGAILSYIMCKAMNRSFYSVILGGFGMGATSGPILKEGAEMQEAKPEEVLASLKSAKSIVIVPGYGMAQSRSQEAVGSLAKQLRAMGKQCRFCIHPVAGRLPGHMNVLLAEANVPYDIVQEMEELNKDFPTTDVVLVVGANDIVNPDAENNPQSVIAGMPVCRVWTSKRVYCIKRSKGKGYAAIENPLFFEPNTRMFYGDAKKQIEELLKGLSDGSGNSNAAAVAIKPRVEEAVAIVDKDDEDISSYLGNCVKEVGVPKEVWPLERRVAITPTVCKRLVKMGFKVKVEATAGTASGYRDEAYRKAGGQIVSTKEVWENTDIIVKIRPPADNEALGYHEKNALQNSSLLISYIYPVQNRRDCEDLMKKPNLTVFALDCTPRITRAQKLDTLSSTANLTGYRAVLEAFGEFPRFSKPFMSAAGKVPPAKVLIMGAGVAGLAAIGIAKGMGAIVRAFDARTVVKEQVESLGAEFLEVECREEGAGTGGYAKEMSADYQDAQKRMIEKQAREVDVIITTALIPGKTAPILIHTNTVRMMKPNSVIVDMAAEMGGNCELTKKGERWVDPQSGVIIIGYTDLASRMAQQASDLFAVNMLNLFEELCFMHKDKSNNARNFGIDLQDEIVKGLAVVHQGDYIYVPSAPPAQPAVEQQKPRENQVAIAPRVGKDSKDVVLELQEHKASGGESSHSKAHGHGHGGSDESSAHPFRDAFLMTLLLLILFVGLGAALMDQYLLLTQIFIFILSIIIGFMVVWGVSPALHTPLMAVTNAISGIIVVGCMLELPSPGNFGQDSAILAIFGTFFASINVFGGFVVTQRMLAMFKK